MEPAEPIRGRQPSGPPTDRRFFGQRRSIISWVADFYMSWFAFFGLGSAAIFLASFNPKIHTQVYGLGLHEDTAAKKLACMAISFAISAAGFAYMLWRYRWRYRLSTLLKISLLWPARFSAAL